MSLLEEKPIQKFQTNSGIILIVEDDHPLRDGLRDILASEGFTVLCAANGLQGLEQIKAAIPDLILSDIVMPEMDGYAFFESVRSNPDWMLIPFVFLTAYGEKSDILTGKDLGVEDYLVKPLSREELLAAVRGRMARARQLQVAQLQLAYKNSLTALSNAIDGRDSCSRGHVERVAAYAEVLAERVGWQDQYLDPLRFGAILHDIGKIFIPETTLLKPGPLSEGEWVEIKQHPLSGAEMIKEIPFLAAAAPIVRHHHERWDGGGYPDKLAGEAIPEGARILAVAEGFDAMTSNRPYAATLTPEESCEEILQSSETQYAPSIVVAFQNAWGDDQIQPIWDTWQTDPPDQ